MRPRDLPQYRLFLEYAKSMHFNKTLTEACITTLMRSREAGDGSVFTDALLNTVLEDGEAVIKASLSSLVGTRGDLITDLVNESSFSPHILVEGISFERPVDEDILEYIRNNPDAEVDIDTVFTLELKNAVDVYSDRHTKLAFYIQRLILPIKELEATSSNKELVAYSIAKFQTYFIDAFTLAAMLQIHPFDMFLEELHNSEQTGHSFRSYVATYSGGNWPVIPVLSGHCFRSNLFTYL